MFCVFQVYLAVGLCPWLNRKEKGGAFTEHFQQADFAAPSSWNSASLLVQTEQVNRGEEM